MHKSKQYPLLETINYPSDLKRLKVEQLPQLADELRKFLIETVSKTGGHLGSNLGSVELTIALHYIFDTPKDQIVWDVGSQAYSHKVLTGRRERFSTNRQYNGIAPFPKRDESEYDSFGVGHSSTSVSAALGMATARDLTDKEFKVVACIGDGGITGGLAFEGFNNAGAEKRNLIVILNDNSMSISPSVGALSEHLTTLRANTRFEKLKDSMWELAGKLPVSDQVRKALHGVDAGLRAILVPGLWFERLGFRYVGPIDGHNLAEMVELFGWLKNTTGPVLVHVLTEKGKGYEFAQNERTNLHGVNKFDPTTGPVSDKSGGLTYSAHFSSELVEIAKEDERVVAITPAMIEGSALGEFKKQFPDRCFDVGIAEQHAICFAAGLATKGIRPVVPIYSSFLQRAYDQVIHDVALQRLPVVLGVDRAGIVGEDGPTHHGAFDISYLRPIPNMVIFVPRDGEKTRMMLREAVKYGEGPVAIRFPRGVPPQFELEHPISQDVRNPEMLRDGADGLIIGAGPVLNSCLNVARELYEHEGINLAVVDLQCVKPLPEDALERLAQRFHRWITIEENVLMGGIGSALLEFAMERGLELTVQRIGIPDRFVMHGDMDSLFREIGMDARSLYERFSKYFAVNRGKILKVSKVGA